MNDPGQNWFAPSGDRPPQQPSQPPPSQPPQQQRHQRPQPQQPPERRPQQPPPSRPQSPQGPQGPQRLPQYPQPPQHQQPGYPHQRPAPAVRPDHQVWPPPGYEPVGSSTQPIPALPSAGPLFQPPQQQPPQPPQPPDESPAVQGEPDPPKRSRPLLYGIGAIAALLLAVGLPTGDRYLFYKSGQPSDVEHSLQVGQSLDFEHVKWSATFAPGDAPANRAPDPTRQWMKIVVTRVALDKDGSVLTAVPELALKDAQDRSWYVQMTKDTSPTEPHEVGKPYTIEFMGVVPPQLAQSVELHLRPNTTYRMDTPTEDLMKPATSAEEVEKAKHKDVLVFRR